MDPKGIIEVLPENVANQIAAGEVVQRPASVVKELLENSVDSEAKNIKLILEDAGRTLIKVSDDGSGMNNRDLQLAFERHATSKIRQAKDLFTIYSMGFRGEALASIAAVAQVTAKTKVSDDSIGWQLNIEGGKSKGCNESVALKGTEISVRNLFFNIPARRNFLKSDTVEFRHASDEFQRVALANPEISFRLEHNGTVIYNLPAANYRKRIISLMGVAFDQRLVPVQESTPLVSIDGFVGKPEFARKTRGEQFLFVNSRFVKSPSLHHAVLQAFEGMIQEGRHPAYFLQLKIDPKHIDINIHPTKTEIKFDDEKSIYGLLKASIRHALGQFNISPSINFDTEVSFQAPLDQDRPIRPPTIKVDPFFNPFDNQSSGNRRAVANPHVKKEWNSESLNTYQEAFTGMQRETEVRIESAGIFRWNERFVVKIEPEKMRILDINRAHEKVIFEEFYNRLSAEQSVSQQLLFPIELQLKEEEKQLLKKMESDLLKIGFDIEFSQESVKVLALPYGMNESGTKDALDELLEWEMHSAEIDSSKRIRNVASAIARTQATKSAVDLEDMELESIVRSLNQMNWPHSGWDGRQIWWEVLPEALKD